MNNSNVNHRTLSRDKNNIKKYSFLEGLFEERLIQIIMMPSIIFLLGGFYAAYVGNIVLAFTGAIISVILSLPFLQTYVKKIVWENGLVPNEESKEFCLQIGNQVIEHKSTTLETSKEYNIVKPLLVSPEYWSRHGIICGTTGAGKTVYLQYIAKQLLDQGTGFTFVNGKPDLEMKKEMFALCALVGREQDFYCLDFNNKKISQAMSIFDTSKEAVIDNFNFMLGQKGDGEWGQKAVNLMSSIVGLFMDLKEHNLVFPHKEIANIDNIEDLKRLKHEHKMGFWLIDTYLVSSNILDLIRLFDRLYQDPKGKEYLDFITGNDLKEEFKSRSIHFNLLSSMMKLTNLNEEEILTKSFKDIKKEGDDPFYSVGIAIDYWTEIIKKFAEDYGEVLDSSTPEININDILRGHKILYISLPGTATPTQKELLGKILVSQIKSAYEKIQNAAPMEVPYTFFLDEFNSWSRGIQAFGDIISQTRSKRLCFYFLFQDSLDSMDDGKGLEGGQILANANIKIILKVVSQKLIKSFIEDFGKEEKFQSNLSYQKRDFTDQNDKNSLEESLSVVEKDKLKIEQISGLQSGQCYIKIENESFCAMGGYHEPIRYETSDPSGIIPLELRYPKQKFLKEFEDYLNSKETPDIAA